MPVYGNAVLHEGLFNKNLSDEDRKRMDEVCNFIEKCWPKYQEIYKTDTKIVLNWAMKVGFKQPIEHDKIKKKVYGSFGGYKRFEIGEFVQEKSVREFAQFVNSQLLIKQYHYEVHIMAKERDYVTVGYYLDLRLDKSVKESTDSINEGLFGNSKPKISNNEAINIIKQEASKLFLSKYKGKNKNFMNQLQYEIPSSDYVKLVQVMLCPYNDCMANLVDTKAQQLIRNFANDLDSSLKQIDGMEKSSAKFQTNMVYVTW